MKILLRYLGGGDDGTRKETVELAAVPHEGEEIHRPDRILGILKTMHFPLTGNPDEYVACCYVQALK